MAGADLRTLKPLIPLEMIPESAALEASIRQVGVLKPLMMNGPFVVDGLRRLKAAMHLKLAGVPVAETPLEPYAARLHFNLMRPWTLAELCLWHAGAPEEFSDEGLKLLGKHPTPELKRGLMLLAQCPSALAEAASDRINLGMLKDLVLLGPRSPEALERLARTQATVGQRREIAFLLKILFLQKKDLRSNDWPPRGDETITLLKARARPELEAHLAEFRRILKNLTFRKGVAIRAPEAFEEPGFFLDLHVTNDNIAEILDFFDANGPALRDLAEKLP